MGRNLEYLENRDEAKKEQKYYLDNKKNLTDKENTELWRISFATANIYTISKWRLLKGGMIYYNQDASIMSETVNWDYDYRNTINSLNATVIQGQFDFLDFNATKYKEQVKEFKNIKIETIPNAGHVSWIDNPKLFRKYLMKGLTK
jgi:pimeloyl-ACP methyl ester carboxylesterase